MVLQVAMRATFFALSCLTLLPLQAQEAGEEKGTPVEQAIEQSTSTLLSEEEIAFSAPLSFGFKGNAEESKAKDGYTINYNIISILEYLRFASKVCGVNFIFNNAELDFTVSVVSDAPITAENVMSTLVQVLRMHGMELLEQDNNLVIHKAADVRQIATLVTESGQGGKAAIVTRIFRIKNARVDSVASVIRPMISAQALLETSVETRQLILTDVRTNVDKVASLIEILDSPSSQLEITTYEAVYNEPSFLIDLASQILAPISHGNPIILVPQGLANSIFVVSTPELNQKALAILATLDTPPKKAILSEKRLRSENIFIYKPEHRGGEELIVSLNGIAANLKKTGLVEQDLLQTIETARWIPESNSILFVGTKESVDKIKELLSNLDASLKEPGEQTSFFIYRPQNRAAKDFIHSIKELTNNLKSSKITDSHLIETLQSVKLNEGGNSLTFSGEEKTFTQVKELLSTLDIKTGKYLGKESFLVYKPTNVSTSQLEHSLKHFTTTLDKTQASDEALSQLINGMQLLPNNNSLLFAGPDSTLKRLEELLPSFDAASSDNQFFMYKPKNLKGEQLLSSVKEIELSLKADKFSDPALLSSLQSMKYVKSTNSILFTGSPDSLKKVEELVLKIDTSANQKGDNDFILYQPKFASRERIESYLSQLSDNLAKKGGNEDLLLAIRSVKWVEASHSFMFHGNEATLSQLSELLDNFDSLAEQGGKTSYFIYKVQNTTGDIIEDDLDNLAKNFASSGLKDVKILDVIKNIRYVKETNSLLLTGNPQAIEETKTLISQYDYPRAKAAKGSSNFLMYKPLHLSAVQIQKSLKDVAENLKKANLADPSLLMAIETAKYVEATNSIIFTGSPDTIQKIQSLLKDIDIPPENHTPIQHIGKTTFLLYKLKNGSGPRIITSLQNILSDLKKSGGGDKNFLNTLSSMKYIKETNSLLFTGDEESLKKVEALVEKFDVTSLGAQMEKTPPSGPTSYYIYKPQFLPGPEIEQSLQDFSENLKMSGHVDPDLYNAIYSARWVEKNQTLMFTGTTKALDQVKGLLKEFDVSNKSDESASAEQSIQAIDNTSFLVYKLQFHKGNEIQNALRQIAKDMIVTNTPINQNLLSSINSIQWLEATNSLLCSGAQETLTRLRELIKNLDIPLKQVFIEMLVIETTLGNALNFGLEWGSNFNFRNQYSASTFNTSPNNANVNDATAPSFFDSNLGKLAPPNTPTPQLIGIPAGGFDLGVIGEVIKHNGQTYLTLGSLLQALQSDTETTIVMTPKIIAQDGKTASLFQGNNVPFLGSYVSNVATGATVQTANIEYRDIGVNLSITPVLGNSDVVTLDISLDQTQTVNSAIGSISISGNSVSTGITTSKTTMQTMVHVPDKHFLILTGMVNNSSVKTKTGIPCLGGLPLIGAAFSTSGDAVTNYNLVVFLRPHILTSVDDMQGLSRDQEDFFRDQCGTPFLQHNFDEAMDYIKSIDDE